MTKKLRNSNAITLFVHFIPARYHVLPNEPSPAAPEITRKEFKDGKHDGILVSMVKIALTG